MRHIVATLIVAVMLVLVSGSLDVHGQDACTFVGGFARVRELVGSEKIGACLEDEHFNADNGNTEQRTTGGLMVWRKADNFTAFTDGGTTWVNGPDGLQSRPNNERFAWETDPVTQANAAPQPTTPPAPTLVPTVASSPLPSTAAAPTRATTAAAPVAAASPVAAAPAATPTKAATPTPAVTAKFKDKPDEAKTGTDVHFEIETSANKKATCTFYVKYNGKDEAAIAQMDVDDNKCETTYNIPKDSKTGKATAKVVVNSPEGLVTIDDEFDVKKGDVVLGGDVKVTLDPVDMPDDEVGIGDEIKITIDTDYKKEGICDMNIAWPKYITQPGESKTPDGDGKCSWKMVVPAEIPKRGTATLTIVVRKSDKKNNTEIRTLTKEFEVKK